MLLRTPGQARSGRMFAVHGILAIDKHLVKRYDKKPNLPRLIKSESLRGTTNFEAYIAGYMFDGRIGCHVAAPPVIRGGFNAGLVRKIMAKCRKCGMAPSPVLPGRDFCSVGVINAIVRRGSKFLMPAVRNSGAKRAMEGHVAGRRSAVSRYVLRSSDVSSCPFRLALVSKKGAPGDYLVFTATCG